MSNYLTGEQYKILMHPGGINEKRVRVRDGNSYVEAHDIKAEMIRVYGFGRFSWRIVDQRVLFEREVQTKAGKAAWQVGVSVHGVLSVSAPDGTFLAEYSGAHVGTSIHPDRGEANGNALVNADSYAFKRAALYPLGTQGGLGLYNKGSMTEIIRWTAVIPPDTETAGRSLDPEDTPEVEDESLVAAPAPETRDRTTTQPATTPDDVNVAATVIYERMLAGPDGPSVDRKKWIGTLIREAAATKCLAGTVNTDAGPMLLKVLLEREVSRVAA